MNPLIRKSSILAIVMTGLISSSAFADKIDDALKAAYNQGYKDGYAAAGGGSGGGGGSQGHVVGINIPSTSGGSTSGHEVPWVYKYDKSTNAHKLFEIDRSPELSAHIKENESTVDLLKKFEANKQSKGVVVIEDLPIADFDKLENVLKNSRSGDVWIAPASK